MKAHPIEQVWAGSQANFYVGQAIPISDLSKSHRQELIPARELIDLVMAAVASNATAKLFGMDPIGELRKNQFSSRHDAILASWLLPETTKCSRNRSHGISGESPSLLTTYNHPHSSRPDDSGMAYVFVAQLAKRGDFRLGAVKK
jgi:hypothetical protein